MVCDRHAPRSQCAELCIKQADMLIQGSSQYLNWYVSVSWILMVKKQNLCYFCAKRCHSTHSTGNWNCVPRQMRIHVVFGSVSACNKLHQRLKVTLAGPCLGNTQMTVMHLACKKLVETLKNLNQKVSKSLESIVVTVAYSYKCCCDSSQNVIQTFS